LIFSGLRQMDNKVTCMSIGDIAVITMGNDEQANAIDLPFCDAMLRALGDIERSGRYCAVILRATGNIFCAGGNLARILDGLERSDGSIESLIDALNAVILAIRRLRIPVIASVQGAAAGAGFSLAMACDLVVASRAARFVVGYAKLGTSTDGGLSFHLAARLGAAKALHVLLVRDALGADDASAMGLVQHVTESAELGQVTLAIAQKISELPPLAVSQMKSLVGMASEGGLQQHLEHEKRAFLKCVATKEFHQRVAAFVRH
jgi:2-(1,2-epoxy-1,2-dihydrophenyl)acetyl-CoA isomerase